MTTAVAVILLDRVSKLWVINNLDLYEGWAPIPALAPYFQIFHTTNTGVAFGMLRSGGMLFAVVAAIAIVVILVFTYRQGPSSLLVQISLGLMLGGAAGNLWDRLVYNGHVIDFLDFHINNRLTFPTFNVADSALVIGVLLLPLSTLREQRSLPAIVDQT